MIKSLSIKIARAISDVEEDVEIVAYGYEIILQEVLVYTITLLAALPFGLFWSVLLSHILYDTMRRFAGGAHAKHRFVCIPVSFFIIYGPAAISSVWLMPIPAATVLTGCSAALLLLYAPADTQLKPITDPGKRKTSKIKSLCYLGACYIVYLLLYSLNILTSSASIFIWIPLIVSSLTHPWIYRLLGCEKSIKEVQTA